MEAISSDVIRKTRASGDKASAVEAGGRDTSGQQVGAGVTALQDCLILVRRAVLEAVKTDLRVRRVLQISDVIRIVLDIAQWHLVYPPRLLTSVAFSGFSQNYSNYGLLNILHTVFFNIPNGLCFNTQDAGGSHVGCHILSRQEGEEPKLCHSIRGLWSDLVVSTECIECIEIIIMLFNKRRRESFTWVSS